MRAGGLRLWLLGARAAGPQPRCALRLAIVLTRLSAHRDRGPAVSVAGSGLPSRGRASLRSPAPASRCKVRGPARRGWGRPRGRWLRAFARSRVVVAGAATSVSCGLLALRIAALAPQVIGQTLVGEGPCPSPYALQLMGLPYVESPFVAAAHEYAWCMGRDRVPPLRGSGDC